MKALFWIVQAVFVAWVIGALAQSPSAADDCRGLDADLVAACTEGTQVGLFVGVVGILFLWAVVNVILAIMKWVGGKSKPRTSDIPPSPLRMSDQP